MEEYLQQGPPAYKRSRLGGDSLQASGNFLDARTNMVPFGFIAAQERELDVNMAAMPMGGNLAVNHIQDFGQLAVPDWRHEIRPNHRYSFVHKISQALVDYARSIGSVNVDSRSPKWFGMARKMEREVFDTATSRPQYYNLIKEEIHKIQMGCGFPVISSQLLPSSSTTSAVATNNLPLVNMQQNYGPNSFGEPAVTATQSHGQPSIAHSTTSVNLFTDEAVGGAMRIPVTSSIGSARPQFAVFNGRQPGPRPMVHDQVPVSSLSIGDPGQFMPNADQVLAPNLLHSMNALMTPLNQYMPTSAVGSQQRFGLNDNGQGVLSENSSIINSQLSGRLHLKEWHKSVTFNVRNRLIRKMAQILSTTPDPQGGSLENRMHNCISIATSVENETYRTANSTTQYYSQMAKRCHFIVKERTNPAQTGIQYHNSLTDIRRTYEALGIAYPMGRRALCTSPLPAGSGGGGSDGGGGGGGGGGGNANGGNNMRAHGGEVAPPPPPPGVMPGLMGPAGAPLPYCTFARGQAAAPLQQPNHNQLLGIDSNETESGVPLDASEVPEVIKQLAHAYKCQERENQENDVMLLCSLPHCRETKNLLNHITTCQVGVNCCGSTKEIIDHWNRCSINECPICLPVRHAEVCINLNSIATSLNNQMSVNPYLRRHHRSGMSSNYPSTATSGLLSNQAQNNGPNNSPGGRNDHVSPRSSMWHSSYGSGDSWRAPGSDMPMSEASPAGLVGRRAQSRFWMHNRNGINRHERRAPYNNPWAAADVLFMGNMRSGGAPLRGSSLFGPVSSARTGDRLQPYGTPWRSPDLLTVENVRPAHRQPQDSDEPVIIPPEEDATPTEHQQMMAIVKVVKTHGGRLEQKFRCSRRSCNAAYPCIHRRLAASIQSHQTPIPG